MEIFWLSYAIIMVVAIATAIWRRRRVAPYDDPRRTVTALRDRQRALFFFDITGEMESRDSDARRRLM